MKREDFNTPEELDCFADSEELARRNKDAGKKQGLTEKAGEFFSGKGAIAGAFVKICDGIGKRFKRGFIARTSRKYEALDAKMQETAIVRSLSGASPVITRGLRKLRRLMLGRSDKSSIISGMKSFETRLLTLQVRAFGAFFMTFGIYAVIAWFVRLFVMGDGDSGFASLVCGIASVAAAIPLLFTSGNLSQTLEKSGHIRYLLVERVGIPPEYLGRKSEKPTSNLAFVAAGIVLGVLSFFVGAHIILAVLLGILLVWLLCEYPEIGPALLTAAIPLSGLAEYPSVTLGGITLLVALALFMKAIKGKRKLIFGISELPVILLVFTVFCGGFPVSSGASLNAALLSSVLILNYFLTVNLVRNKRNLDACSEVYMMCATVVSAIGIMQYFLGLAPSGWTDTSFFPEITSRASSVFGNPNMLGFYIIPALPHALSSTYKAHRSRTRILGFISSLTILLCTVLTFSRASWFGAVCGLIFFGIAASPRNLLLIPPAALGVWGGAALFPDTFGARVRAFCTLGDSTNVYRRGIWDGVRSMLKSVWLHGTGAGNSAFRSVYIMYAEQGIEAAPHAHSIYLQITAQYGICGIVFFVAAVLLVYMKIIARAQAYSNRRSMLTAFAFAGGMTALLAAGIFDNVFYNYRLLCVFWMSAGLASAGANVLRVRTDEPYLDETVRDRAEITVGIQ